MKLEAKDLSFCYHKGNRQILNHVSLSFDSSERLGLAAPSGFGKTTFCKILAGYEGYCPVQLIWQHPQEAVNPRRKMKTVLEEGDVLDEHLIRGLGIEKEWLERYPGELSGGELQRFCIARALGEKTRFLLADEITAMLDLITQSQIWNFLLEEVKKREIGLLVVSHSEPLLERICTGRIKL